MVDSANISSKQTPSMAWQRKRSYCAVKKMENHYQDLCCLFLPMHNWFTLGPFIILSVPETLNVPTNIHNSLFLDPVKQKLVKVLSIKTKLMLTIRSTMNYSRTIWLFGL